MNSINEQFNRIYDQYIEKIYRFVFLKVSLQEIAEDITSKVFLKLWESYKNGKEIKNPKAFLYKVARNLTIDYYREKDRTKVVSGDSIPEMIDIKADVHEFAVLNSDIEEIKLAITKLKKDYQDVIIWHYLDDLSAQEIAEILEKPAGTVRVMIHRGLQMLREELGNF